MLHLITLNYGDSECTLLISSKLQSASSKKFYPISKRRFSFLWGKCTHEIRKASPAASYPASLCLRLVRVSVGYRFFSFFFFLVLLFLIHKASYLATHISIQLLFKLKLK
jgi:hypothetical protein